MAAGMLLLAAAAGAACAAESDALAISQNIRALHMPYGTVLDPIYVSAANHQITTYTRCGDSALWTGNYLAAEAFRYNVTHSADALANATAALAGIKSLLDVTGNNVLARCLVPDNSPYAASIQQQEASNGIYHSAPGNFWVGNTSRDQYSGVMFGLGVAYDLIDDPGAKASAAAQITRIVSFLESKAWNVVLPDGSVPTTFLYRPDQQLTFLQLGRHVNPGAFGTDYDTERVLLAATVMAPIGVDVTDDSSYFKFNLDEINLYSLVHLESSSFGTFYQQAYQILRNHVAGHQNAWFDMIDRALNGPNGPRDDEARTLLDQWLTRPRLDFPVDLRGQFATCGDSQTACRPVPAPQRPNTDFLWQRSPFALVGPGTGQIETAGIDYLLPYWMGRYLGVITGLQAVSAASGAAVVSPESIASIYGTNLAGATASATTLPPPNTLGGVTVLVKDSLGVTLSAPLYYVSPGQINFLVPAGNAPGSAIVTIQRSGQPDLNAAATIQPVAPAVFTADGSGSGPAAATGLRVIVNLQAPVAVFSCGTAGCSTVPIDLGVDTPVYLALYATGIRGAKSVTCTVGGTSVPVQYAGPQNQYPGLDQVNIGLTLSLRGAGQTTVIVTADGQASNAVKIAIQ